MVHSHRFLSGCGGPPDLPLKLNLDLFKTLAQVSLLHTLAAHLAVKFRGFLEFLDSLLNCIYPYLLAFRGCTGFSFEETAITALLTVTGKVYNLNNLKILRLFSSKKRFAASLVECKLRLIFANLNYLI